MIHVMIVIPTVYGVPLGPLATLFGQWRLMGESRSQEHVIVTQECAMRGQGQEEAREVSFACPRILRLAMKYATHLFTTPLSNVISDNMKSRLILTLTKQFFENQFTHF